MQVRNPIGSNKQSLRSNIEKQLAEALEKNLKNASFLGIDVIRLFEIGTVYSAVGEDIRCSIAVATTDKKSRKKYGVAEVQLENIINTIEKQFKVRINLKKEGDVCSFSLNDLMGNLKIEEYGPLFDEETYPSNASFKNISIYPYSTRDISLWVDEEVSSSEVLNNIKEVAGEYLVKSFLFDEFNKEGRTSYAFSLVFQSQEKTLEDSDVDTAMANINTRLKECLWEVR